MRRGRRKKVQERFQRQAHTRPCDVIKGIKIDGKIRSSMFRSGKFLPLGASEESAGKVPKGEHVPTEQVIKGGTSRWESSIKRSVQGNFFRRRRRKKVQGRFQKQARTSSCEAINGEREENRSSRVSSGKFLPLGALEESARKVPKASTYIAL